MGDFAEAVTKVAGKTVATTIEDIAANYNFVDAVDGVMIVSEKPGVTALRDANPNNVDMREIGQANASNLTGWLTREYNNDLHGLNGIKKYDEMRRSDSTVRGSLTTIKTPILAARWFMDPGSESTRDQNVAKYIWWNLIDGMSTSFPQLLHECLLMLNYGYYMFEKVFTDSHDDPMAKGKIAWKKLSPRHPADVTSWEYDANGGPDHVKMYRADTLREVEIPIDKLLVFTFDKEGNDVTGISLLRSAYKPWYYKSQLEKIDAIQKERHGIGIPIIKLPPNYDANDKLLAQNMGRNLRTNEQAHIVLPPNWEVLFADLKGNPVDVLKSIEFHDKKLMMNVLAPFMDGGTGSGKDEDKVVFLKSTRFIADIIEDVFNKYLIPQLVDYNWSKVKYPKLRARRIGESADWRTMSFAIRNLIGAGVVRPDDRLEENMRQEMDLPAMDPSTVRLPATPQNAAPGGGAPGDSNQPKPPAPSPAGPPRQAAPGAKPPAANAGRDGSGG